MVIMALYMPQYIHNYYNYTGASDAPGGGVFTFVGGGLAAVVFIIVIVVIIAVLVAVVCVKKRKTNVNGMKIYCSVLTAIYRSVVVLL